MMDIVFGSALGVLLAEALLQALKLAFVRARRDEARERILSILRLRESDIADGFVKYAGAVGVLVALTVLGGWGLADYLSAKSSEQARNGVPMPSLAAALPEPARPADQPSEPESSQAAQSAKVEVAGSDPYSDSEFEVRRRGHRAGASSLKDAFLRRSEDKARADLLRQTQERGQRSQYDCEAAVHASRYLKAGLDVWGFTTWQVKYFPLDGYKGATLSECKGIKEVIDPKRINVKSAVANRSNM